MSLSLSIVIPALGDIPALEQTLVTVLENRPARCEVLVVLNAPYNDPYDLGDEVRFVEARPGANWAESMNAAIEACRGPVMNAIYPGVDATPDWTLVPVSHFYDEEVVAVAPLVCDRETPGKVLSDGVEYFPSGRTCRRRRTRRAGQNEPRPVLGPSHLAGFYRVSALRTVGGFTTTFAAAAADVDMALQLQHLEGECLLEPSAMLLTSKQLAQRPHGPFQTGLANERLFLRNAGADGWARSLITHPVAVLREDLRRLPNPLAVGLQMLGRAVAWTGIFNVQTPYDRLDEILDSREKANEEAASQQSEEEKPSVRFDQNASPTPAGKRSYRRAG